MTYSGKRLFAPVYREYKGQNGVVQKSGYMSTTENTALFLGLLSLFQKAGNIALLYPVKTGAKTNARAGDTKTKSPAEATSKNKTVRTKVKPTQAKGHRQIRISTWEEIPNKPGRYHEIGFTMPKFIPIPGCQLIMGVLLKGKIALEKPNGQGVKKCQGDLKINGSSFSTITELPAEADRYYLGDIIETTTELGQVADASKVVITLANAIAQERTNG